MPWRCSLSVLVLANVNKSFSLALFGLAASQICGYKCKLSCVLSCSKLRQVAAVATTC